MPEDHSRPSPDNSGIIETRFDDTKRGLTGAENKKNDSERVVKTLKNLFNRFTGTHEANQATAKPEVMLMTAGMVPADTKSVKSEISTESDTSKVLSLDSSESSQVTADAPTSRVEDKITSMPPASEPTVFRVEDKPTTSEKDDWGPLTLPESFLATSPDRSRSSQIAASSSDISSFQTLNRELGIKSRDEEDSRGLDRMARGGLAVATDTDFNVLPSEGLTTQPETLVTRMEQPVVEDEGFNHESNIFGFSNQSEVIRPSAPSELSKEVDKIAEHIDQPILPGEIDTRRRVWIDEIEEPATAEKRSSLKDRIKKASPKIRKALALAGLVALVGLLPDGGSNRSATETPPEMPKTELPFAGMPELPKAPIEPSPLDDLPKMQAVFPTEGPAGENISPKQADLGGWFDAEWVKAYKAAHPMQFDKPGFDMRDMYDLNLLRALQNSEQYKESYGPWMNYVTTHEVRGGDPRQTIQVDKNPDGSIKQVLIDVGGKGAVVPAVDALFKKANQPKE